MNKFHVLHFIGFLLLVGNQYGAVAFPTDSQEVVGFNVGGLHADLKTNLFSPDGPLAQLGNEISSGASQLQNELTSGAQALQADFNNAANSLSQGSQEEVAGINLGGLHADLKTNLFSNTGPLAQIGSELEAGANALENDFQNGANALQASLAGAAGDLQAKLAGGADLFANLGNQLSGGASLDSLFQGGGDLFSNLGNQISGGASLDSLFQGGGDLFSNMGANGNAVEKDTIEITGGSPGSTKTSGTSGISISGQISGQPKSNSKNANVVISGQSSGLPQTSGNLKGFTINVASGQKPQETSSGEKNSQGGISGGTITRTITTGTNTVLTPELLAEIYKTLNLKDVCKAMNK